MRSLRFGLGLVCTLALGWLTDSGCQSPPPSTDQIAHAIAISDSLHRRPIDHRVPSKSEGYPVASSADSDSVIWLNAAPDTPFSGHEMH